MIQIIKVVIQMRHQDIKHGRIAEQKPRGYRKNIVCVEFSTIYGFRYPLEVLGHLPHV
jgi:hypothetical protein